MTAPRDIANELWRCFHRARPDLSPDALSARADVARWLNENTSVGLELELRRQLRDVTAQRDGLHRRLALRAERPRSAAVQAVQLVFTAANGNRRLVRSEFSSAITLFDGDTLSLAFDIETLIKDLSPSDQRVFREVLLRLTEVELPPAEDVLEPLPRLRRRPLKKRRRVAGDRPVGAL